MSTTRPDWLNWKHMSEVKFRQGYVSLPAFTYTNPDFHGAGIVVAQYNYSADRNFRLTRRPAKPTDVNYGLCIRFRVGTTVYRYRLWEFDLNPDENPLYTNQLIGKNFVLEIWTLQGQTTSSQDEAITLFTSLRTMPTDYRDTTAYAIAEGAEVLFSELQGSGGTGELITDNLVFHYKSDDVDLADGPVATLPDKSGNGYDLVQSDLGLQPVKVSSDPDYDVGSYILFDGVDDILEYYPFPSPNPAVAIAGPQVTIYLALALVSITDLHFIMGCIDTALANALYIQEQGGGFDNIHAVAGGGGGIYSSVNTPALYTFTVVTVQFDYSSNRVYLKVGDDARAYTTSGTRKQNIAALALGAMHGAVVPYYANMMFNTMIGYNALHNDSEIAQMENYLKAIALQQVAIEDVPTTYATASAWLDNEL